MSAHDSVRSRFFAKVSITDGCWLWTGFKDQDGYGRFNLESRRPVPAHRLSFLLDGGEIPEGYVIDHLCRNTSCVNPQHLEAVTRRENAMRGVHPNVLAHHAGRCRKGHDLSQHGRVSPSTGRYRCRLCHTITQRERRQRVQST